jgi:hypothetical protein
MQFYKIAITGLSTVIAIEQYNYCYRAIQRAIAIEQWVMIN